MIRRTNLAVAAVIIGGLGLSACELGPKETQQVGYRGTGMVQVTDPQTVAASTGGPAIPAPPYATPDDSGPRARDVYQNVPVLGGVSAERFNHLMAALNTWIVPANLPPEQGGCNYCHNPANLASDEKYTKVVARRMLQMTQSINANWSSHVGATGVTCWTCHRGNAVPQYNFVNDGPDSRSIVGRHPNGQNQPNPTAAYASLPGGLGNYLAMTGDARVSGNAAIRYRLPREGASLKATESTYATMMHMSQALGVNCTFCHNTQAFRAWDQSRPQRATAWYGIRMARDINNNYITPLTSVFPANRLGPHGDPYKANCQTCHQGQNKPMGGVSMLQDYPVLRGPAPAAASAPPVPAPAPGTGPDPQASGPGTSASTDQQAPAANTTAPAGQ